MVMNARSTELVTAVGTARTFEPRLTGGFAYAPVRGPVRGANDAANLSPDVRIAIAEIEKQHAAKPVAATAAIVSRRRRTARSASSKPSRGCARTTRRSSATLSAAYLARAERTNSDEDASRALAAANRALEIDR